MQLVSLLETDIPKQASLYDVDRPLRRCNLDFTEIEVHYRFSGPRHWRLRRFLLALERYSYTWMREQR